MTCHDTRKLLDPYIDNELDLVNTLEIERHLQDCVECQLIYQNHLALQKSLKAKSLYYELPHTLRKRIHTNLVNSLPHQATFISRIMAWRWVGLSISLAVLLLLVAGGTGVILLKLNSIDTDRVTQEVLDSHIRSLMLNHLEDVISTDQHTVKPWFNGKLDFSPIVEDFAPQGYPLIGGRLDYLDKQPVAVVVYQRGKHIINLFTWKNTANTSSIAPTQNTTQQGFNLVHWTTAGSNYWVVSDLNESELGVFVQLVKTATIS